MSFNEAFSNPPEILATTHRAFVIMDIDGVVGRWVNAHLPNPQALIAFHQDLNRLKDRSVGIGVLTNRPAGHLPLLAYNLGVNQGFWIAESGGVIYDVSRHQAIIAPDYVPVIPQVTALRQALTDSGLVASPAVNFNQAQFEPGGAAVKTVVIPPSGISPKNFAWEILLPFLQESGFVGADNPFTVSVGKAIDIDPVGLSKASGMAALLELNGLDPRQIPCLWIADADRDIDAATYLHSRGGQVAAVGNSSTAYLEAVVNLDGLIAPRDTSYHSSVSYLFHQFLAVHHLI